MGNDLERFPSAVADGSLAPSTVIQTDAVNFRTSDDFSKSISDFPGERFAGIWKGDFEIVRQGEYNFFLLSKDGAYLFVDGIQLIDNGGRHGSKVEQGKMNLAAGIHSYKITYWDNVIAPELVLKYKGPDTQQKENVIQPVKFSAGSQKMKLIPGLQAEVYYFSKVITQMPNIENSEPMHSRTTDSINFKSDFDFRMLTKDWPEESAALVFTGIFMIGKPGLYSFSCTSNSGSHVWIDGNMVIDNGGEHDELEKRGSVELMSGYHMLKADFWKSKKDPKLTLRYEGPDTDAVYQLLRGVHFSRPGPPPVPPQIVEGAGWCAKWYFAPNGVDEIQQMPRFNKLIPQKIEIVPTVDYQGLDAFKAVSENSADRIAVEFLGEHRFEKAGMYKLCLTATSTATFKLSGQSVVRLETKDGKLTTECKSRYMSEQRYMVAVEFYENGGDPQISLHYTPPDSDESLLLPSTGYPKDLCDLEPPTCECGKGWCSKWYLSPMGSKLLADFPDVSLIEPQLAKRVSSLDLGSRRDFLMFISSIGHSIQELPPVLARFSGYLIISKMGPYIICTDSSDGSVVFLNNVAVVASPGVHESEKKCESVSLQAGAYLMNVTFFHSGKDHTPSLRVTYSGPDTGDQEQVMESAWHSVNTCGATPEIARLVSKPPTPVPSSPLASPDGEEPKQLTLGYHCKQYKYNPRFQMPSQKREKAQKLIQCRQEDCKQAGAAIGCHYMSPQGMCWSDIGQRFCATNDNKETQRWCKTEVTGSARAYEKCDKQGEMAQWERDLKNSAPLEQAKELPSMPMHVGYYCNSYYKWKERSDAAKKPFTSALERSLKKCQIEDCKQYRLERVNGRRHELSAGTDLREVC
jgi:hypothetical protein